jgi:hypothetical protein
MAAAQLQRDHKHWLVIWGCYTRSYVAFPLFNTPRGTVLTASAPGELTTKMRRTERASGVRVPAPSPAQDWQGQPGRQGAPGQLGWQGEQGQQGWQNGQGQGWQNG